MDTINSKKKVILKPGQSICLYPNQYNYVYT